MLFILSLIFFLFFLFSFLNTIIYSGVIKTTESMTDLVSSVNEEIENMMQTTSDQVFHSRFIQIDPPGDDLFCNNCSSSIIFRETTV